MIEVKSISPRFVRSANRKIKPRISQRYPLERGGEAIRALMDRTATGKLVVLP